MNASWSVYGAARPASAAALGRPCTDSSQCTTVSRSGYLAASSRRAVAEDHRVLVAVGVDQRRPGRCPRDSADLQIAIIGVMPLPAASSRKSASSVLGTKVPDGASTWIFMPGWAWSHSQFDA